MRYTNNQLCPKNISCILFNHSGDLNFNKKFILIGNKHDLEDNRIVNFGMVNAYANKNGILYKEISALSEDGIDDLLKGILERFGPAQPAKLAL